MSRKEKHTRRQWPWQQKPGNGLPSTGMSMDNSAIVATDKQAASSSLNVLHLNCSTLPLSNFIEILISGNLRWLIINGHPTQEELSQVWDDILQEYVSLVKTDKADTIFSLYKKIKITEWQLVFIEKSVMALKIQYDEEIAIDLSNLGFGEVIKTEDKNIYLSSLYSIETSAKMLIVLLNQYYAEYKSMNADTAAESVNMSDAERRFIYEKELSHLSKFQGFRIIKEKISVLEYCAIVNNYLEEIKIQRKGVKDGR